MMRTQLKTISVTSLQIMLKLIQSQVLYLIATILTGIQTISWMVGSTITKQAFSIWTIDNKLLFYYMIRSESSNVDINESADADYKIFAILFYSLIIVDVTYSIKHVNECTHKQNNFKNGKSKNAAFYIIIYFVCNANPRWDLLLLKWGLK